MSLNGKLVIFSLCLQLYVNCFAMKQSSFCLFCAWSHSHRHLVRIKHMQVPLSFSPFLSVSVPSLSCSIVHEALAIYADPEPRKKTRRRDFIIGRELLFFSRLVILWWVFEIVFDSSEESFVESAMHSVHRAVQVRVENERSCFSFLIWGSR